jgi:hypothetical protein
MTTVKAKGARNGGVQKIRWGRSQGAWGTSSWESGHEDSGISLTSLPGAFPPASWAAREG